MKYRVGDKVKIREDLITGKWYGCDFFVSDMAEYKGKTATITTARGRTYSLDIDEKFYNWDAEMLEKVKITKSELQNKIDELEKSIKNNYDEIENLKQKLKNIKEPILDEAERKYLSAVIRPFKDRVNYIKKVEDVFEYICIDLKDESLSFSYFDKGTMYKGMMPNKKYTLKELSLDE